MSDEMKKFGQADLMLETIRDWSNGKFVEQETGKRLMTNAEGIKLEGIEPGAEVNVQSDWSATSGDAFIKNKPTKLSDFTNDPGFITKAVDDLTNYYKKTETYTQDEVNELVDAAGKVGFIVVDTLPTASEECIGYIYLTPKAGSETRNVKEEWICLKTSKEGVTPATYAWEKIGDTEVDLTDYAKTEYVNTKLATKVDKIEGKGLSTNDYTTDEKTKLAGIEAGADVNIVEKFKWKSSGSTAFTEIEPDTDKAIKLDLSGYALTTDTETKIATAKDSLLKNESGDYSGEVDTYTKAKIAAYKAEVDAEFAAVETGTKGFETVINSTTASSTKGAQTQAIKSYVDTENTKQFNSTDETGTIPTWVKAQGYVKTSGVTSVGLEMPSMFDVSNSPITTTGNIKVELDAQSHNLIFAGPASGTPSLNAKPTFRSMVPEDLPGEITSDTTGNAATATDFENSKQISLSGAVSGSAFGGADGEGWAITTTIADGSVSNAKLAGGITNAKLVNDSVKIGSTEVELGATATTLSGLTSVSATTFIGNLTGTADEAEMATKDGDGNTIKTTYATKAELQNVQAAFNVKESVATYEDLPKTGNTNGDVRCVLATGVTYVWTGTAWTQFSTSISLATKDQAGIVKIGDNITNEAGLISVTGNNVKTALGYAPLEGVKVNGTLLDVSNRTVNVIVPTDYATEEDILDAFTAENIEAALTYMPLAGITVSGEEVEPGVDHKVNIDLTSFATETWVEQKIKESVTSIYNFRGSVETYDDLPDDASQGDVYNVEKECVVKGKTYSAGTNFAWDGTEWDALGGTMDMTLYYTKDEVNDLLDTKSDTSHTHDDRYYTQSQVGTLLNGKVDKVSGKSLSTNDYTDADKAAVGTISSKLDKSEAATTYATKNELSTHTGNNTIHVTSADKLAWSAKYEKPTNGIPGTDLAAAYGDSKNPYGSKSSNYVLAAPNGSAGVPSFRALVIDDISDIEFMTKERMLAILNE